MGRYAHRIALSLILLLVSSHSKLVAQPITMQIAAAVPVNSPWDHGLRKLAAEWAAISGGRVRLAFPRSMANASQADILQKMRLSLDGGLIETSGLYQLDNDYLYLSMPAVIRNEVEFEAVTKALAPIMARRFEGLYEVVTIAQGGWLRFFSNRELAVPSDIAGMRIGVNENQEALIRLLQALGARTVKSDASTVLLQFNSNALDVGYTSPIVVATLWSQYRRSVTHMSGFRLSPFFGALLINKRSWDRVPAELRPALKEAADRIAAEIARETLKLEEQAIASMTREGLRVPRMSDAQLAEWNELFSGARMQGLLSEWFSADFRRAIDAAVAELRP